MADSTRAETLEASDVRKEKTYPFMTINMECKGKGNAADKRELIISTIKRSSASVIFCQEAPGKFRNEVVEKCSDDHSKYNFVPQDIHKSANHEIKVAVMWREEDFDWGEVDLTKYEKSVAHVTSTLQLSMKRSAMVKLTSRVPTEASFLAVSWYGPKEVDEDEASKAFYDLIYFVREVCENEDLSWFIIGGDLIFDTSKVHLTEVEGVTISYGPSFVPIKDIFVFSVPSMNELPMTEDITLSEEKPRKIKNESSQNGLELKHVPVVRNLNLSRQDRDTFTEDANKSRTLHKTTNEKDRPEPTPEKTGGMAKVISRASGIQKKLFEDGNDENDTTDKKKRHSSGNVELNKRENIEDHFKNKLKKQIKSVQGDGHCMVNAFSLGLKEKYGQGVYSKESLLTNIENEFSKNRDRYSDFVDIKEEDLKAYIEDKKYDSSLVDLIPLVVANITNTFISILQVQNGQVSSLLISPTNMPPEKVEGTIYVYKTGDHYDAILECDEAASGLKIEASTSGSNQSSSAIPDGYVTRKDFQRLISLVEKSVTSIHAKIDRLTAEVAEIKLAIKCLDGPHGSVSQAQPTEPHSQTTKVWESPALKQGSDRESTSEKKKQEKKINK